MHRLSPKLFFSLLFLGIAVTAFCEINIDVSCGLVADPNAFNFTPGTPSYKTLSCGASWQMGKYFGLGIYGGYVYNSPLSIPINGGIKIFGGNINHGFAGFLNLGLIPSVGLYIKNFIIDVGFGQASEPVAVTTNGVSTQDTSAAVFYPYLEIGYSIPIRTK